jgi:MoaA/NifB/PqqE/SkfB family radical SAM enzyme
MFAKAMHSANHPILAQIVPVRRCNLACSYCNEFDAVSNPVPLPEMLHRVDLLARLGTTILTISGGEPLLHPGLDHLIRHIRNRGALATLITNGYLLTPERIRGLNRAGLDYLQISIDNVVPDSSSKKSLKVLDRKLVWLAEHAEFAVTINSVLGPVSQAEDALQIARRARELGFTATVGLLHDSHGQAWPLTRRQSEVYEQVLKWSASLFSFAHYDSFQRNLARGLSNEWHCRAGSRFLYVCEDGLVHYCSQQRGRPGIPLDRYSREHFEREFRRHKPCEAYCTISCVHQAAMLDGFRERPGEELERLLARRAEADPSFRPPPLVGLLAWAFLHDRRRALLGRFALKVLGVERPS